MASPWWGGGEEGGSGKQAHGAHLVGCLGSGKGQNLRNGRRKECNVCMTVRHPCACMSDCDELTEHEPDVHSLSLVKVGREAYVTNWKDKKVNTSVNLTTSPSKLPRVPDDFMHPLSAMSISNPREIQNVAFSNSFFGEENYFVKGATWKTDLYQMHLGDFLGSTVVIQF